MPVADEYSTWFCLAVYRAFIAVERLAEAHRAAAGAHHLLAFAIARHAHAGGADIERALFDHHIATEGGDLVGLIERALIGLDFNRAAAVALKRKSRRGGQ